LNLAVEAARQFRSPKRSLGELDAEAAAMLIAVATDVALVIDAGGVIRDVAVGSDELAVEGYADWIGQPWVDTVTIESRRKVEEMLRDAAAKAPARWRQVNHPSSRGDDMPMLYSAVQVGSKGRVIAVGRNLRSIATLQQKLLDVQQSMERDYLRLRHAETRYRLLFQMASEAVLIIDAGTQRVVEANPAAAQLLEETARRLVGRPFPEGFDAPSTQALQSLLAAVRAAGSADEVRVRLLEGRREFMVNTSMFRQDNASLFLVRLSPITTDSGAGPMPRAQTRLSDIVDSLPDGFVVTDVEGRILTANRAFLDLIQLATEEQARDESVERWLGRPGVDLNVLLANLRQHGSVRMFATTLRGEYGANTEIEISAVSAPNTEPPCLGFTVRNIMRRPVAENRSQHALPRSVEQLTELVGRVSLKELVRETTDVIERLCIEAALELTGDNRASAAEMLGLSRQSLYVKLRRYGLGDLAPEA
jgi:transcriptional regulator PpsR